jgi:hypothetical protein
MSMFSYKNMTLPNAYKDELVVSSSSCIKIPQLGHGDNNVQSPQMKGAKCKMSR